MKTIEFEAKSVTYFDFYHHIGKRIFGHVEEDFTHHDIFIGGVFKSFFESSYSSSKKYKFYGFKVESDRRLISIFYEQFGSSVATIHVDIFDYHGKLYDYNTFKKSDFIEKYKNKITS